MNISRDHLPLRKRNRLPAVLAPPAARIAAGLLVAALTVGPSFDGHLVAPCHAAERGGSPAATRSSAGPKSPPRAPKDEARARAREEADLDRFLAKHTRSFRKARGDEKKLRVAITRYLEEGSARHMSPLELRDYFDISSPGLLEEAGFNQQECERGAKIFDQVAAKLFEK